MNINGIAIRGVMGAALAAVAVGIGACGGGDETQTTPETAVDTTSTSATAPTEAKGDPDSRAKAIVACLKSQGFETIQNPGNSRTGEDYNLVVGGSISVIHGFADEAAAQRNLDRVEAEASQPSEVNQYGDVVLEVHTSEVLDAAAIDRSRTASESCVA